MDKLFIKKITKCIAVLVLSAVMLAACGNEDMPDYEIITINGWFCRDSHRFLREQVDAFNLQSSTHQIHVIDYDFWESLDGSPLQDVRFMIDMMTGNAPDIIFGPYQSFSDVVEKGLIIDLYPLIDTDPALCRTDFFPNILGVMEAPDGTLPAISYTFSINTFIGLPDVVGGIESWTVAEMLALIEQTEGTDIEVFSGAWMTAEMLLNLSMGYGQDYIDWQENKANLDSEEFIQLLEISSRFPNDSNPWYWDGETSQAMRMLRGEQLLTHAHLFEISNYQMYTDVLGDDIIALGIPTKCGGAHVVYIGNGFAVSANSPHKDAAWDFIRQFLQPDLDIDHMWSFPLRMDIFERMIEEAKIPNKVLDVDSDEFKAYVDDGRFPYRILSTDNSKVEIALSAGMMDGDLTYGIYALTETEERNLRAILENASIPSYTDLTVMNIVREETPRFFTGERSAADTARVMQNRIQTYLNERR